MIIVAILVNLLIYTIFIGNIVINVLILNKLDENTDIYKIQISNVVSTSIFTLVIGIMHFAIVLDL